MSHRKERVCRITRELNEFMAEASSAGKAGSMEAIEDLLTTEVISDFKSSIDSIRQLLWMYIETASRLDSKDADYATKSERFAQAAEMLRLLRNGAVPPIFSNAGFVDRVSILVDTCTQKAQQGRSQKSYR